MPDAVEAGRDQEPDGLPERDAAFREWRPVRFVEVHVTRWSVAAGELQRRLCTPEEKRLPDFTWRPEWDVFRERLEANLSDGDVGPWLDGVRPRQRADQLAERLPSDLLTHAVTDNDGGAFVVPDILDDGRRSENRGNRSRGGWHRVLVAKASDPMVTRLTSGSCTQRSESTTGTPRGGVNTKSLSDRPRFSFMLLNVKLDSPP